jgi:hypothetical protein
MPGFGMLLLMLSLGFLGSSCGGSTGRSAAAAPAPTAAPLTQADSGRTLELAREGERTLRLAHRWSWSEPHVTGGAVRLDPINYFADPGFDAWTIVGVQAGSATITATGRPGPRPFKLTVRVG